MPPGRELWENAILPLDDDRIAGAAPVRLDPSFFLVFPIRIRPTMVPTNHATMNLLTANGTPTYALDGA